MSNNKLKIIFLGTNGWYDTETGNTLCILIKTSNYNIILDAGNGFHKLDKHLDEYKPFYLFLSHFHLDHIIGLHTLAKLDFKNGLNIVGNRGMERMLDAVINIPYTIPFKNLPYKVNFIELYDNINLPFPVTALALKHSDECLGYRFVLDDKIIAFCTDTGYCENAVKLAEGADLLIAECAALSGEYNVDWPHLNPETAARIAKEAGAKMLALVHFDARNYQRLKDRDIAAEKSSKIFRNSISTMDDMIIEL